jgi:hypothetical protein
VICLDHATGLRLACDIWDEILPGQGVYSVSAVPAGRSSTGPAPAARSAFVVVPARAGGASSPEEDPTPVTYGTPFRLESLLVADGDAVEHKLLAARGPCFLASSHKSERMASRLTNRQMAYVVEGAGSDTLWTFERAVFSQGLEAAEDKYFSKDQPVEFGTAVVVQHVATRQALLADPKQTEITDFGSECEVVCKTSVPPNIVSSMARESKGSAIVTVPLESAANHWGVTKA